MSQADRGTYHFGEFQLNLDLRVLVREGQRVPLGPKAYDVLTCLVAKAGSAVNKTDILKYVWPESFVEEGTLAQHVFSLRKALGDKADCIVTVPGFGYRFAGAVRHELAESSQSWTPGSSGIIHEMRERTRMVLEEPILPDQSALAARRSFWPYVAALLVAVLIAGGWAWSRRGSQSDHVSVVLSEFTNSTGDSTFDHALSRALQIDLEQSPYVDVIGDREELATLQMMGKPSNTPLDPAIAREICVRTNRQALLTGNISNVAGEYLLTLEGIDCNTGKHLASSKSVANSKSMVLSSLDSIAEHMRSKLGESAKSIQSYEVPISQATTSSLEALQAYSTVTYLTYHGPGLSDEQRLPFYKKAVELDPQFAMAYVGISSCYYEMLEPRLSNIYLKKAYDLRDRVTAKEKLMIEARYSSDGDDDMLKSIETYRVWTATYPREWVPWLNTANLYNELGLYSQAIAAAERAEGLEANDTTRAVLIRAYKNAGRYAEAKAIGEESVRHGSFNDSLFEIAFYEGNSASFDQQVQFGESSRARLRNYFRAIASAMLGKYKESHELFAAEIAEDEQRNVPEVKDGVLVDLAEIERDYGLPSQARATLARMTKGSLDMPDVALEHAQEGDIVFAEHYLAIHGNDPHPPGSYLGYMWFPLLQSSLAMHRDQPEEALKALEPTKLNDQKLFAIRTQRAEVCMALHRYDEAIVAYKDILTHQGSGFGIQYPMAHLGLARAYGKVGNRSAARGEYTAFLDGWKYADPDLPVLLAAKQELTQLH